MTAPHSTGYVIVEAPPSVDDYLRLRRIAGLSPYDEDAARIGLAGTIFGVSVRQGDAVVGMGRLVGDGGCFFQVTDIAVDPAHQGEGLGRAIMAALVGYLETKAPPYAYVSLIADGAANQLYEKFGFAPTAPKSIGMARRAGRGT